MVRVFYLEFYRVYLSIRLPHCKKLNDFRRFFPRAECKGYFLWEEYTSS